ncbi:MAG TPA: TRL-like family protein [bacterium]|nr:TRL-like family protein [bacterium]
MKRLVMTTVLAALCVTMMTGCGAIIAMGGGGTLYQDTKTPLSQVSYWGPSTSTAAKKGEASFTSILGIIATGDASLKEAMESGGITKVHHIDQEVTSILGIISTYKIIVYGE